MGDFIRVAERSMSHDFAVVWDDGLFEREITTSEVSQILGLIDALNGRERTLVTVHQGDAHIAVGGSAVSGLVSYVTFDGESFHQLRSHLTVNDEEVAVVAGRQSGSYPRRFVVDAGAAKAAVQSFVVDRELDPHQQWET